MNWDPHKKRIWPEETFEIFGKFSWFFSDFYGVFLRFASDISKNLNWKTSKNFISKTTVQSNLQSKIICYTFWVSQNQTFILSVRNTTNNPLYPEFLPTVFSIMSVKIMERVLHSILVVLYRTTGGVNSWRAPIHCRSSRQNI